MKKILIIGASGFVGAHLYEYLNSLKKYELIGTYYSQNKKELIFLDYFNKKSFLKTLENVKPDIVIWSAGEKNMSRTENDISFNIKENIEPSAYEASIIPPYFYLNIPSTNKELQKILHDLDIISIQVSYRI